MKKQFLLFFNIIIFFISFLINADEKSSDPLDKKAWHNQFHQTVSDNVFKSAQWFDSFFLEEGDEQISPRTSARIKIGWEPKARDFSDVGARFKLKVRLPHFKEKVDLIFSDSAEDQFEELPLASIEENQSLEEDNFSATIRYIFKDRENAISDARFGTSSGDLFFRLRHKRSYNWRDNHTIRIEPALFYFLDDGFGSRLFIEYDYQINPTNQFRINTNIRSSQSFSGIRWEHGFYYLTQWSDKKATVLGIQLAGERNQDRGFTVDEYSVNYRYRFNALEEWLFFEIEPFIEFTDEDDFKVTPGLALRIEGFFS